MTNEFIPRRHTGELTKKTVKGVKFIAWKGSSPFATDVSRRYVVEIQKLVEGMTGCETPQALVNLKPRVNQSELRKRFFILEPYFKSDESLFYKKTGKLVKKSALTSSIIYSRYYNGYHESKKNKVGKKVNNFMISSEHYLKCSELKPFVPEVDEKITAHFKLYPRGCFYA